MLFFNLIHICSAKNIIKPIPPGISGYNLIALIGVNLAVALILAKKKLKK